MPVTAPLLTTTNFGPPEGNDTIAANAITAPLGTVGGGDVPSTIGTVVPLELAASVGAVTGSVVARVLVRGRRRVLSISSGNVAVTGVSSFDIYNETQAVALCAAQVVTTGGTSTTTTITNNPIIEDGDVIALRGTSGTSITSLAVLLVTQILAAPPGL